MDADTLRALTTTEQQALAIEAVRFQRRALQLARWAYLNELGAFEMREAASLLRAAADRLEMVSDSILMGLPQYGPKAWTRPKKAPEIRAA